MNYLFFDVKHYFISTIGETFDVQKYSKSLFEVMDVQLFTP
jgi:hypothetical protein